MTRVAAIDCGTNSIRLLIADVTGETLTDVVREMRVVRLGQDVDRTGVLADEALARTFAALRDYAVLIRKADVHRIRMCATSATRDARNRDLFVRGVVDIIGMEPDIIGGAEEAATSFRGATATLTPQVAPAPYLVVDIGGGSTELVLGSTYVEQAISVELGCVRLTERCLPSEPPSDAEIRQATAVIDERLDAALSFVDPSQARTLVGLAGSVTTVAALVMGLPAYDAASIHHQTVRYADVDRVTADLLSKTPGERLSLPVMHPGRADVIGAGALILRRIMERTGMDEVVASERDILDGIALSLV